MIAQRETISSGQLAMLLFTFMTGSSIINIPGPLVGLARAGAWLSLLMAYAASVLLLLCMTYLYRVHPGLTFVDCCRQALGRTTTWVVMMPFLTMLIHMNIGITLDVGLFMNSSMMQETPMYMFHFLLLLTSALTARAGIEVMARLFLLTSCFMVLAIGFVLLLLIPNYDADYLLPILPDGWKPVVHGAYFAYGFPYAEIVALAMLLAFVPRGGGRKLGRRMQLALLANAVFLTVSVLCSQMVFGSITGERKYLLFQVAQIVDVGNIIERIESTVGMTMILGSYMKLSLAMFALNLAIARLFRLHNERALIMPIALLLTVLSIDSWKGYAKWSFIVTSVHPIWVSLSFVLPLLLVTAATWIRRAAASGSEPSSS
ncbi:GerAB/ArcD/ProY family transporter [Paenibacillus cymbidii]|uniref:GerAB/ArcD/ProY family transporter n=1 Tax=Paenibacillus cymbidii TaxID=1639034 RepID=UPI00108221E8|nr:GerAB/ArcD/ProY family transporter [Paenibacillus cymbidii]